MRRVLLHWSFAGHAVSQDDREALNWIRRAAEQGQANAQSNLGLMYVKGRGVPQNFVRSYMWFSIAAIALSGEGGKDA